LEADLYAQQEELLSSCFQVLTERSVKSIDIVALPLYY
jgi:hypothetical protein